MTSSEGDLRPLYVWVALDEELDMGKLRAAKGAMNVEYRIKPVDMDARTTERVLAVGSHPRWVCDYFFVSNASSVEIWTNALRWVLGEVEDDWDATGMVDVISHLFPGEGTREVPQAELDGEVRFRDYVQGVV